MTDRRTMPQDKHKAAAAKGLAQTSQLLKMEDVSSGSTADLVAKVAGDALRSSTPRQPGQAAQGAGAVYQLLDRFQR